MIHWLDSDLESFKTLRFRPGLNVLLADKSEGATDRQSRNGAGKSSVVELVHFLFGGNANRDSIFRSEGLRDCEFSASVDVGGEVVRVSRRGAKPGRVVIEGRSGEWPVAAAGSAAGGEQFSNEHWKTILGRLWYGLENEAGTSLQPTFRSLFSLAARRQGSGGFHEPTKHTSMQQAWDQQACICYLLGLDWEMPGRFQELRNQDKIARELRRTARSGDLGRYFGKAADLRTALIVSEERATRLRSQLDGFRVLPQYEELEREASEISDAIGALNLDNVVDLELIRELRKSLAVEEAPALGELPKLYEEVGLVLPELARRRLADVERFHRRVIENRRSHLSGEISAAEARMGNRERRREALDGRRRELMNLLDTGGALGHYSALREELGRVEAVSETLRRRLETVERLDSTKAEIDMERTRLVSALRDDIRERDEVLREAVVGFEELSEALYERAGSLSIGDSPSGPKFEIHIDGERSRGITNMQIFCFDLMLIEVGGRRGTSAGFLIHDSHLFDGVDERQVAKALQLGAERAESGGFQYIVTMNSDSVPADGFRRGFEIEDYVIEPRLTDATESGGLFGFRFN